MAIRALENVTVSDAYLALMADRGVEYLCANAGNDFVPMIEALARAQALQLPHPGPVTCPHENTARHIAIEYSCAASRARAMPAGDGIAHIRRETGGRAGKTVAAVAGLALDGPALVALCKRLKSACGTGGTVRDGVLEFQGDHRDALISLLAKEGVKGKLAGG